MKKNGLKAVLNMSKLSVPAKINKARLILNAITANAAVFTNPSPSLADIGNSITELETAWQEAEDKAVSKKTAMRDKEAELLKTMNDVANYVEAVADGDESIIHLATLQVKRPPFRVRSEFEVLYGVDSGSVVVRLKAVKRAAYVWQYTKDLSSNAVWQEAGTTLTSKTTISGLTPGVNYWFRVAIIDKAGRHEFNAPISLMVV